MNFKMVQLTIFTATIGFSPIVSAVASTSCGKIYNIGGFDAGSVTGTTRIYDIATDSWNTGTPIPQALTDDAIGYWNGKIYVAGGYDGSVILDTLRAYDIATDTWSVLLPMPYAAFLPGFGVIDGKLYIAGGYSDTGNISYLQIYDIAAGSWSLGTNAPMPVTAAGSAVMNGKLYVFGGGGFPAFGTSTQIYDPATKLWSSGHALNAPRRWFYGTNVKNSIVAAGGDNGSPTDVNEQFDGAFWNLKTSLPHNDTGPFVASDGTYVYIGGGFDGSSDYSELLRYDPVADSYTSLAPSGDAHYLSPAVFVPCGSTGVATAATDVKFCGNPNAFNCRSQGVVPATIFGTADIDVSQIDLTTVKLCLASDANQCIGLVDAGFPTDRGNPATDIGTNVCTSGIANPDGLDDLDVTFDSPDVANLISCSSLDKGQASPALIIEGNLLDGTPFQSTTANDIGIDELLIQSK